MNTLINTNTIYSTLIDLNSSLPVIHHACLPNTADMGRSVDGWCELGTLAPYYKINIKHAL